MENKKQRNRNTTTVKQSFMCVSHNILLRKLLFIDKVSGESVGKSECKKCNVAFSSEVFLDATFKNLIKKQK
jgi:hypothetical protein